MPNWCNTYVCLEGPSEVRAKIAEVFERVTSKDAAERIYLYLYPDERDRWDRVTNCVTTMSGFEENWLGNLACYAHGTLPDELLFRGRIYMEEDKEKDVLIFTIESAYGCHLEPLVDFIEAVAGKRLDESGLSLTYSAEEPGAGLFITNDYDLVGKVYCSEFCDDEVMPEELLAAVNERLGTNYSSLEEAEEDEEVDYDGPVEYLHWEDIMNYCPEWRTNSIRTTGKKFRDMFYAQSEAPFVAG